MNENNLTRGITISPFFSELTVTSQNQTAATKITIYNGGSEPIQLNNYLQPLKTLGAIAPSFSVTNDKGLDQALTIEQKTLTIPPHDSRQVTITLKQISTLTKGGHYAVLTLSSDNHSDNSGTLSLNRNLNALLFMINDTGDLQRELNLIKLDLPKISLVLPRRADLTFANKSDVHVRPYGEVLIKKDQQIKSQGIINESSKIVLPREELTLGVDLKTTDQPWLPTKYTVEVNYHPDQLNPTAYQTDLLVIPQLFLLCLLGILLLVLVIVKNKWRGAK